MRIMIISNEDGFRSVSAYEVTEVTSTDVIFVEPYYEDEEVTEIKYPALRMVDEAKNTIYLIGYLEQHEDIIRSLVRTGFYDFSAMENKFVYNPMEASDVVKIKDIIAEDKERVKLANK